MPYCTRCGSEVFVQESFCANCGFPRTPSAPVAVVEASPPEPTRVEPLAVASLVVGIAGLLQMPMPVIPNIIAIVLGTQARARIRENSGLTGDGLATAGIVLAIVGLVVAVLLIIAVLLFFSAILDN